MKKTIKSIVLGLTLFASVLILWGCNENIQIATDTYYLINEFGSAPIYVEGKAEAGDLSGDFPGVVRVAHDLQADILSTTGANSVITDQKGDLLGKENVIIIGTIEKSQMIKELDLLGKIDTSKLTDKWESYIIQVIHDPFDDGRVERALVIVGSDRRGAIYGTYKISEMLGVSPFKFFGDNEPTPIENFELPGDYYNFKDEPTVQYRGIFINDEEELAAWSQQFDEGKSMGPNMYHHIFEMLLRLNANYIWPAMHGASDAFNDHPENARLADYYGIVVGTSHVDMMLRNNNNEWSSFVAQYKIEHNYTKEIKYDYTVNPEILREYWRTAVEWNKDYEVQYTLGMRAVHDEPIPAENINQAPWYGDRVALMENIIEDQRQILREVLDNPTLEDVFMVFTPYKEVQEIYNQGLELPEDVTIIWVNDNHGYIRQLPNAQERERAGGNGLYYHNSYWGPDNESYMWLNSMPHAFFRQELSKAIAYGTTKNWILNVGDIVPGQTSLAYFIQYAYDADRYNGENAYQYAYDLGKNEFGEAFASDIEGILRDYGLYTHVRKLEMMAVDLYTNTNYSDEYQKLMSQYKDLLDRAESVYERLPDHKKDAFYLLILYQVRSAYNYNAQFYYATNANSAVQAGKAITAYNSYYQTLDYYDAQMYENSYYNNVVSNGKWDGILEPNYYIPPVAAGIAEGGFALETYPFEGGVIVEGEKVENDDSVLTFGNYAKGRKFIDVFAKGAMGVNFTATVSDPWIQLTKTSGHLDDNERIWVEIDFDNLSYGTHSGTVTIQYNGVTKVIDIEVSNQDLTLGEKVYVEQDGYVSMEAEHFTTVHNNHVQTWETLKDLGRIQGDMMRTVSPNLVGTSELDYLENGAYLSYDVYFNQAGTFDMEVYRLPTLNANGRLRFAIQVNDDKPVLLEGQLDAEVGNLDWQYGLFNQIFKHRLSIDIPNAGIHTIKIYSIDPYLVFDKYVIYTEGYDHSNLGPNESYNTYYNNDVQSSYYDAYYETKYLPEVDYSLIDQWGSGYVVEQNNKVLIESEYAQEASAYAYTTNPLNGGWLLTSHQGGMAMRTKELNFNYTGLHSIAPTLNYQVAFNNTGQYNVWVRVDAPHYSANSFGFGMNGIQIFEVPGGLYSYQTEEAYIWKRVGTMSVSQTGVQTVQIYAMADGLSIDKIYLTKGSENPENGVVTSLRMETFNSNNMVLTTDEMILRNQLKAVIDNFGGLYSIAHGEALGSYLTDDVNLFRASLQTVYNLYNATTPLENSSVEAAINDLSNKYMTMLENKQKTDDTQNYLLYEDFSQMTPGLVPFGIEQDFIVGDAGFRIYEIDEVKHLSVRTFHENRARTQSVLLAYDFLQPATSEFIIETRVRYNDARWGNMLYVLNESGEIAISIAFENSNGPSRDIVIYNGQNKVVVGRFEYDEWVDLKVTTNILTNTFTVEINGESVNQVFAYRNTSSSLDRYQFGVQNSVDSKLDVAYIKAYLTADRVINDIDELVNLISFTDPNKYDDQLLMPIIPEGYELEIINSSQPDVIDLYGNIKPDIIEQVVQLTIQVKDLQTDETRQISDIDIVIPGVSVLEAKQVLLAFISETNQMTENLPIGNQVGTFDETIFQTLETQMIEANNLYNQTDIYYADVLMIMSDINVTMDALLTSRIMSETVDNQQLTYYALDHFDHYMANVLPYGFTNVGTGTFSVDLFEENENTYLRYNTGAPGTITNYLQFTEALSGTVYIDVKVKDLTNSASQFTNLIYLMNDTDSNKYGIAVAFERSGGQTYLQYHDGSGWKRTGNIGSNVYTPGMEVEVSLILNIDEATYDIYMDGNLIYENVGFRATDIRNNLTRLMFGTSRQNENVLYDYIKVYQVSEVEVTS
ncbi:MAG: glycosyl hydrolase 115 family protein [Acholeplasma sp.]